MPRSTGWAGGDVSSSDDVSSSTVQGSGYQSVVCADWKVQWDSTGIWKRAMEIIGARFFTVGGSESAVQIMWL